MPRASWFYHMPAAEKREKLGAKFLSSEKNVGPASCAGQSLLLPERTEDYCNTNRKSCAR